MHQRKISVPFIKHSLSSSGKLFFALKYSVFVSAQQQQR
jgi:hypothetical protein